MSVLTKEDIKQTVKIVDLLDRYGIKHNKNKASCPFHKEKTASFTIYHDTNSYYCFGCGVNGDIFKFIQQMENCSFKESLKLLGGGEAAYKPTKRKPTAAQRKEKRRQQIHKEWLNCLDVIRENSPPIVDIDLSVIRESAIDELWELYFNPEYVKQLHRLPYLDYLIFEGADTWT